MLDDSIGCALWFAARGVGSLRSSVSSGLGRDIEGDTEKKAYTNKAKVKHCSSSFGTFGAGFGNVSVLLLSGVMRTIA